MAEIQQPNRPLSSVRRAKRKEIALLSRMVNSLQEEHAKGSSSLEQEAKKKNHVQVFLKQNRFVGREKELTILNNVYQRVCTSQSEVVLIHGPSGAGKSTLLDAFIQDLPPAIFYVSGKFDQLQSHAPYAALVSACEQLCRQVLRRDNCNDIRDRLRELLGSEINLLGSLMPIISKMAAEPGKVDKGPKSNVGSDGQGFTRFKLLFRAFLRCVASVENPIVFFLDDIQWADKASLEVLKALVSDGQSRHIMIIGAYREGKITKRDLRKYNLSNDGTNDRDDCSTSSVSSTGSSNHRFQVTDVGITGLNVDSMNDLIASVLEMNKDETLSLSTLVLNKTDGNVFYALNFLDMLLSKGLLSKANDGSWRWDRQQILQRTNVTNNLATILETKLMGLPDQVRSILQIASFVGHSFTIEILVTIVHEEQDMIETEYSFEKHSKTVIHNRIITALEIALAEGLIETTPETEEYKFSHDKIQTCLYMDLIPDDFERSLLHQRIGSLTWNSVKNKSGSEVDDWVFLAAENLSRALETVDYTGTRYELIEVNLKAAALANDRFAFLVAAKYLRIAVNLVEGDISWDNHYDLCIDLYCSAASVERYIGHYERSMELTAEIHSRAKSSNEKLEASTIEVQSLCMQGNLKGSIVLGLNVLGRIGVKFPRKIGTAAVVKEVFLTMRAIGKRPLEEFLELPEMTDRKTLLSLDLMNTVAVNAVVLGDSYKEMYAVVCLRMVRLTIKHGLSALFSPMGFSTWGTVNAVMGRFDVVSQAGNLSMAIVERFNAEPVRGRAMILNGMCQLWTCALDAKRCQDFQRGYQLAISFGDVALAHVGILAWFIASIYMEVPLADIHTKIRSLVSEGREYESSTWLVFLLPTWQVFLNLSGDPDNPDPSRLIGEAFDDDAAKELKGMNSNAAYFAFSQCNLVLGYIYEDWDLVRTSLSFYRKNEREGDGFFTAVINYCWAAFCYYDLYRANGKRKDKAEGRRAHRQVKVWAEKGNLLVFGASKWLTAMESLCVKKSPLHEVERFAEEALIAFSGEQRTFFKAMALERMVRLFLVEEVDELKGHRYLSRTIAAYRRWGATAKAEWLEERYNRPTMLVKEDGCENEQQVRGTGVRKFNCEVQDLETCF